MAFLDFARAGSALLLMTGCEAVLGLSGDRRFDPEVPGGGANGGGASGSAGSYQGGAGSGGDSTGATGGLGSTPDGSVDGPEESGAGAGGADADIADAGPLPEGPSCAGMSGTECRSRSCCANQFVPGGAFAMGRSVELEGTDRFDEGLGSELPEHPVTVSPFWLDVYEVTVGRFRRFVDSLAPGVYPEAQAGAHPQIPGSGWRTEWNSELLGKDELSTALYCHRDISSWTRGATNSEQLPLNCVTWYEAFAFCIWEGGRLPTEAEWEFAAAGGAENRLYPWGQEPPDSTRVVMDCSQGGVSSCTKNDLPPVGKTAGGNGLFGHADLGGSLNELTFDAFSIDFYSRAEASGKDVANLGDSAYRSIRGGSFNAPPFFARATHRSNVGPTSRWNGVGFRCARNP